MVDMGTLVGTIRRFGLEGPAYEILSVAGASSKGEPQMRVHAFESGETFDYPVSAVLSDPSDD